MLAAVLTQPRQLLIQEVEEPKVGSLDVLVRIKATSICGSDREFYNGRGGVKFPVILGHESAGVIEQVGSSVATLRRGDRVVISPPIYCGNCFWCRKGLQNICANGLIIGRDRDGTFAEYISVPEKNAYKLPDAISFEEATIIVTFATVVHSHKRVNILANNSVAVMGCGLTGLLHIQLAKSSGARPIIAVSRSQWKLNLAKKVGADFAINSKGENQLAEVEELTEQRGVDLAIEAVGRAITLGECVELVRPGGTVLAYGMFSEKAGDLSLFDFFRKELSIIASRAMAPEDWAPAIEMVNSGKVDVRQLITHRISFQELKKGFDMFEDGATKAIRIIVNY